MLIVNANHPDQQRIIIHTQSLTKIEVRTIDYGVHN